MDKKVKKKVKKIISDYYKKADLTVTGLEEREFGIGNDNKIEARHLEFENKKELRRYLITHAPLFVSHSAAYYEFPGARPMNKKEWKKADIIFDLDFEAGKYEIFESLEKKKENVKRLVESFLISDFGVKKEHILIVFSGNRGYHIHVRDPAFQSLKGEERRELVDYITGQGLNYKDFFSNLNKPNKKTLGPTPEEEGYKGEFARETIKILNEDPGSISRIFKEEDKKEFFISGIKEGNWSRIKGTLDSRDIIDRLDMVAKKLFLQSVKTDAKVTQDLSKLIRVPGSVHGGSGLIAKPIKMNKLEDFDPLNCIPKVKGKTKIKFTENVNILEQRQKGEKVKVDRGKALFYVLKDSAKFI